MKILVTCDCELCPEALDPLRRIGQVDYRYRARREELVDRVATYQGWLCDTRLRVDKPMIDRADQLRAIATSSTGTDHLDKAALAARSVRVIDIASEYDLLEQFTATAEGAWVLLMAAIRRLPCEFERAKRGEVGIADSSWAPPQLSGKTLGIVGCGRLGRMVAEYGRAFRMRALAFDARTLDIPHVHQVDLDTLLESSDVVSLHLHLTDQTRSIIGRERFARMKRGAVIVNTARGDLIDETALLETLESGHLGAAGLDVVHNEWDPDLAGRPLLAYARTHDNLIITPHVASVCHESITKARIFVGRKLAEVLQQLDK